MMAAGSRAYFPAHRTRQGGLTANDLDEHTLGFAKFNVKRSQRFLVEGQPAERFPVLRATGGVDYYLELPTLPDYQNSGFVKLSSLHQRGQRYSDYLSSTRISCKAVRDEQVYLSATGHVFPCCWLGQIYDSWPSPMAAEIRARIAELADGLDALDLRKRSFAEIIDGPFFQELVVRGWRPEAPQGRLSACGRMCGEIDTHSRQWESGGL